ncbi:Peroxisomal acyl-coenzyme A oxidase 1 [Mactra antiquata]
MSVNPDLLKERKSATFDVEKLTELLYNGKDKLRRRRYLQNIVFQDKYLQSFKPWWNRTRNEKYETGLKKTAYLDKLKSDLNITDRAEEYYITQAAASSEPSPLGVHGGMFLPTLEKQANKEQIERYLKPAQQYKIIGTYAQTELGHGTFIRGLETTATYDPKTEEFIINSPTLTSMKYWPGGLGKSANYVVLMAQLYTKEKCHGLHSFVVQIRSMDDHKPMPGVTVGDIGNKLGYNSNDNGFLIFDHVRIPRDAMLMRYAKVDKDGTYTRSGDARITYGTMVLVRANIVANCGFALSQAVTIVTRYSAVRRQTEIKPGGEEPQVIDYQTQQEKIFPLIAASYAFQFIGITMLREYFRISGDMERGEFSEMQVLHATAAGLKAFTSDIMNNGIDRLRMACGGHGYSHASGLPKIWANIVPACTYEGENTVMYLQCARYLVKQYAEAVKGKKLSDFMSYLNKPMKQRSSLTTDLRTNDLIEAFEHVAARLIQVAATSLQTLMKKGATMEIARNNSSVLMVRAAKAHCQLYVVKIFCEMVSAVNVDTEVNKVLNTLCQLYAVCGINDKLGDFMQDGYLSESQAEMISNKMLELFAELRPNAVGLVDAFDYPDQVLQSCIGRYDGNVYEALYEYAKGSPLNKTDVHESYYTTLRPLMKGELSVDGPSARL